MILKDLEEITFEQWMKIGGFACLGMLFVYYAVDLLRKDTRDRTISPVPISTG